MRTALGGRFAISAGRVAALPAASICPRCWYLGSSDDSWRVWGLWGGQDAGWRLCWPLGLPQRPCGGPGSTKSGWVLGDSSLVRVPLSSLFQTLPLTEGMCRGAEYWALGDMGSHPVRTQVTPGVAILHPSSQQRCCLLANPLQRRGKGAQGRAGRGQPRGPGQARGGQRGVV